MSTSPIDTPSSAGGSPSAVHGRRKGKDGATDRPTPGNPMPGAKEAAGVPSAKRVLPPELGTDAIAVLEGRAFFYSDSRGNVPKGSIGGFVNADTRFIGTWVLTMGGEPLPVLRAEAVDYYAAAFFCTNPQLPDLPKNALAVVRNRSVGKTLTEDISIQSYVDHPVRVELRLEVGTDYADLFEIKDVVRDRSADIHTRHEPRSGSITFHYTNGKFEARSHVKASDASIEGDAFVWDVELEPRGRFSTTVEVDVQQSALLPELARSVDRSREGGAGSLSKWMREVPKFESDSDDLEAIFRRSVADLAALRISGKLPGTKKEFSLPAAGLPWFMTLFGRDTLFTAFFSMWVGPELARGGLEAMALLQGTKMDDFHDEEPGKILHEARAGELTQLGLKPHNPYYGNTDATQLWLILLTTYWRWTGNNEFVRGLKDNVVRALEWIDKYGDRDGDGYVEYGTRSPQGLGNQCWKDSWEGIQFADGRIPFLPIAVAEAQGYSYEAKVSAAELAERVFDDADWAARLRKEAEELKARFNKDYWVEERGGYYAVGLDGDKNPIDSMTSNMGHLLTCGIVPEDRAKLVVEQLMSEQMFSGWGIRTMSSQDAGFNPIGYHLGTIWPHDNAFISLGLTRYGFREEANRIASALVDAAGFSRYRLPEAFAGFSRDMGKFPVPYPTACSPQAWATSAPFALINAMLGLRAEDGQLVLDPHIPPELGRMKIRGVHAFGTRWDVEAVGTNSYVRLSESH